MKKLSIVWMRRNLRLQDNKVIAEALRNSETIFPIYIFDIKILKKFPNPTDRRLSFIANILYDLNVELRKHNGELTVFHGNPTKIVPKLAKLLDADSVYADEDFEPENIERDEKVKSGLLKDQNLELVVDHLLLRPDVILKNDGNPFKKITPYIQAYKDHLENNADDLMAKYTYQFKNKLFNNFDFSKENSSLKIIDIDDSPKKILDQIGYEYIKDELWHPSMAKKALKDFISYKIQDYKENRHLLYVDGTSRLSPYLRFGVLSIRQLFYEAYPFRKTAGGDQWLTQLICREFYVCIIFHFPETVTEEFQEKFRNKIKWNKDDVLLRKFEEGKTGYPIVDACVRQLLKEGWMHNRGRMIVSSFLSKNLFMDWRLGEEFFSQYLMDYELSTNTNNWQWTSSVGVENLLFTRVFKPSQQQKRFDKYCEYIKKYVPELREVPLDVLIKAENLSEYAPGYPKPIVEFEETREYAIDYFKKII